MSQHPAFSIEPVIEPSTTRIVVVGVGGGGGNAVAHMAAHAIDGVRYVAANTDDQALRTLAVPQTLQLGMAQTKGMGAGADPAVGRAAAVEDREAIQRVLEGADMVFVAAGMGGGTGTGAAPVVAHAAKALDKLTVAVVTRPFDFENRRRIADDGIADLRTQVDSMIVVPNQKLLDTLDEDASLEDAFAAANEVLRGAVDGIAGIIAHAGQLNVDFRDVRRVLSYGGATVLGTGEASGAERVQQAMDAALGNPLLEEVALRNARGVLVNVLTERLSVREFREIGQRIEALTDGTTEVILGRAQAPNLGDDIRITVVAAGLGSHARAASGRARRGPARGGRSQAVAPTPGAGEPGAAANAEGFLRRLA